MEDPLELRRELILPASIVQLNAHSIALVDDRQVLLSVADGIVPLEVRLSLAVECAESYMEAHTVL